MKPFGDAGAWRACAGAVSVAPNPGSAMIRLSYKGRIHKAKLSGRSLRYIAADQLVRAFPALQSRWQFPVEATPIADAAVSRAVFESVVVDGPYPGELARLLPRRKLPVQTRQNVFRLENVTVTGQAGVMLKDGRLLAVRKNHNWVSSLRPRRHSVRRLAQEPLHYNLISPLPARGHIFHWLFDYTLPLLTWLECRSTPEPLTLLVNAELVPFQKAVLDALLHLYDGLSLESVEANDAVIVPRLEATVFEPYTPRALQTPAGLATLDQLAGEIAKAAASASVPRRFYISRSDARLRRVVNEAEVMAILQPLGFEQVVLKGMPIAQQVRLFREADAIVSPHGAGLAHLAWCRPGTRVFEVFPSPDGPRGPARNATDNFWLISRLRQLNYAVSLGGPRLNHKDSFEIPAPLLRHIAAGLDAEARQAG